MGERMPVMLLACFFFKVGLRLRVYFLLYTDCYMRFSSDLPSIQPGYSDSSDTTCHVHGSATCVCNCLVPRVLSEGGGTSPSSDLRHELMFAFFVVFFRSNECRGTVVPRAVGPTQYCTPCGVAIWALPESCRRFLVDCVVLQVGGCTRSMILTQRHGGNFCAWGTWGQLFRWLIKNGAVLQRVKLFSLT